MIDMGFNQKQSVRILYAVCAILGTSAIMFTEEHFSRAIIIIASGFAIFLINFLIVRRSGERGKMGLGLDGEDDYENKIADKNDIPDPVSAAESDPAASEKEVSSNEKADAQKAILNKKQSEH